MSTKANRGTKRTCQSSECGARFYDLARDPIACPICGSIYALAHAPAAAVVAAVVGEQKAPRKVKKAEFVPVVEDGVPVEVPAEDAEALPEVEGEETIAAEADETFLEEEEDGGDVSNIIGPVAEDEEEV